jgi:hypothetical protein
MDKRFATRKIRSLNRAGSFRTLAEEVSKYKLDLAGVQDIKWGRDDIETTGQYTFFYGKRNENHELGTGFFVTRELYQQLMG